MATPIYATDNGHFLDYTSPLRVYESDSFEAHELQDDTGSINLYDGDNGQFADNGHAEYSINPFQSISFISMTISPYFELSLDIVAHT